jgi:transcriptional regulator with XRE-family HTH domain
MVGDEGAAGRAEAEPGPRRGQRGAGEPALTVGATVRALREARGWSLQRLASGAHISKQHLWDIERGAARPNELTIKHLARALGVRVSDLMGETALDEATRPISPALRAFAARRGLGAAQVDALAGLHYRGRAPRTADEWELIWRLLRAVLDDENGRTVPGDENGAGAGGA